MNKRHTEYALIFIKTFLPFLTWVYLPIYLKSIGLTGFQIGLLSALAAISAFLVTFPIGIFNDTFKSRTLVFISMWLMASYYFALSGLDLFWLLILVFLIYGASTSLFDISLRSLFYKTIHKVGKGKELGTFNLFDNLGISAGYLIGGTLLNLLEFKTVFVICGIISLIASIYSFKLPEVKPSKIILKNYFKDLKKYQVLLFGAIIFLISAHWGPERVNMGLFIKENVGLTTAQMGLFFGISVLFLGLGVYYYSRKYDQGMSLKKILIIGLILNAIGSLGWYFTTDPYLAFFVRSIHEFGDGALAAFMTLQTTILFTKKRMGGNSSIIVLIGVIGSTIGALIAGTLADYYSNVLPIVLSGFVSILALLLIPFLKPEKVKKHIHKMHESL